ncbi:MAG: hypothetical protein EXS36_09645 [Pedosphaera sp.]|nr:hypothetical protein [Pedosphaera sp.]
MESYQPRADAKQQIIHFGGYGGPLFAQADPQMTVSVFDNLVSNAAMYSPSGKTLFVRLKRMPNSVRCEVQDEGPGLSAEDQKEMPLLHCQVAKLRVRIDHDSSASHSPVTSSAVLGRGVLFHSLGERANRVETVPWAGRSGHRRIGSPALGLVEGHER